MDVGLQKLFLPEENLGHLIFPSQASSFVVGNINLYLDAQPVEDWSALIEVRLTSEPDGQDVPGSPGSPNHRSTTEVYDHSSASGGWALVRWGALILERAYVQWHHSDALSIRAGSWLTPYGIWNVDHGSPTLISLMLPQMIVGEFFPSRQIGVQAFGTFHFGRWDLEWTGYVSNGRNAGNLDPTEDKAIGGRLALVRQQPTRLAIGTSFYFGTYADEHRTLVSFDPVLVDREVMVSFDELGIAADFSLDVARLRLRSELFVHRVRHNDGKRGPWFWTPGMLSPDRNEVGGYVLAAYQLPWLGLEPYLFLEGERWPSPMGEGSYVASAGMNIHFTHATQLKLQVARLGFFGDWAQSQNASTLAGLRAVMAF